MTWLRSGSGMRRAMGCITLGFVALCGAGATPIDDCNSNVPAETISGCSAVLQDATDVKRRAGALVRRGEAYEKTADLGAAVVDFIAAVDSDPANFYARADLERASPGGGPRTGPDTPLWPRLVEGVAFPRGFEPTSEVNRDRPGSDYHQFSPPSGDASFCLAACFADASCRAWGFVPPQKTADHRPLCTLKDHVPVASDAPGAISGVIRPEGPIAAVPAYKFADGDAFGIRMETVRDELTLMPISASAFPSTGPFSVRPLNPHPLLGSYTADALYNAAVCRVSARSSPLRAGPIALTLLRELTGAFGKPAPESTRLRYIWNVNSLTSRVILERGPTVTIEFRNHSDCDSEQAALSELRNRLGPKMPSNDELQQILARWPPQQSR
jgi:hypothetical protein